MRSLLFVPADGGSKLDKALASGADAVIIDLEDSIAPDRKAPARASAAAFLKTASPAAKRPRLLVRVNAIATGLIDADLNAVVPARPDAILLPRRRAVRQSSMPMPSFPRARRSQASQKATSRSWRRRSRPRLDCSQPAISAARARG
jgi:HpcH/HpaI aldolase/citrate lyase family